MAKSSVGPTLMIVHILLALVAVALAGCSFGTGKDMLMAKGLIGPGTPMYFNTWAYDAPGTQDPQGIIGIDYVMCELAVPPPWEPFWTTWLWCPPLRVQMSTDPKDEEAWATETRTARRPKRSATRAPAPGPAASGVPSGIAFMSRERCEAFRAAHPAYTKPHEVCERVYFKRLPMQP
jgi:hypothetical protein